MTLISDTNFAPYPTMADVITADLVQLESWAASLRTPNSDVERAVRTRIDRRLALLAQSSAGSAPGGAEAPRLDDSVARVRALLGLVGDPSTFDRSFAIH